MSRTISTDSCSLARARGKMLREHMTLINDFSLYSNKLIVLFSSILITQRLAFMLEVDTMYKEERCDSLVYISDTTEHNWYIVMTYITPSKFKGSFRKQVTRWNFQTTGVTNDGI